MKIENGKIIECTKDELLSLYIQRDMDECMDFIEYMYKMENCGCKVVNK